MQRALQRFEYLRQRVADATLGRRGCFFRLQHGFRQLQIPGAEFVPGELVECGGCKIEAIGGKGALHLGEPPAEARADPPVGQR